MDRIEKHLLGHDGDSKAARTILHPLRVAFCAKHHDAPVGSALRLHSLEQPLAVVEHTCGGRDAEVLEVLHHPRLPITSLLAVRNEHPIGLLVTERHVVPVDCWAVIIQHQCTPIMSQVRGSAFNGSARTSSTIVLGSRDYID